MADLTLNEYSDLKKEDIKIRLIEEYNKIFNKSHNHNRTTGKEKHRSSKTPGQKTTLLKTIFFIKKRNSNIKGY